MGITSKSNKIISVTAWLWFAIAMTCNICMALNAFSFTVFLVVVSMFAVFMLTGDSFVRLTLRSDPRFSGVPIRLLTGAIISNIALFLLALILPFGLLVDWLIVGAIALITWLACKKKCKPPASNEHANIDLIFAVISTIAVTIWCLDILRPIEVSNGVAIIRTWSDAFYHMSQIGSLASSAGLASMQDLQMAGASVHPYHLSSYLFPALIQHSTGVSTLVAYAGVFVPFGLLLTSCAAFSLVRTVFGGMPALLAGLSVLLIPDTVHQGFGNQYVGGYEWLLQIAPAGAYGVACAALASMFLLEASRTGRWTLVGIGYFFALATAIFKAQIFVALSFPAFIFPALFMGSWRPSRRVALILLLVIFYAAVLTIAQRSPNIPVMRLDGSGLQQYSSFVMDNQIDGIIKRIGSAAFSAAGHDWLLRALTFIPLLTLTTFGFAVPLYFFVYSRIKAAHGAAIALFPVLIFATYLVMATCLSLDTRNIGTAEELLHRPFVWAYFTVLIWAIAGLHQYFLLDHGRILPRMTYVTTGIAICLLAVPAIQHDGIQEFKRWNVGAQRLPICQVRAAEFVRDNSRPKDIVQDSLNDPHFILSGLAGRQESAVDAGGVRAPIGVNARLAALKKVKDLDSPVEIRSYMQQSNITYYLTNPSDSITWIEKMESHKVFQCDNYRVYRF